MCDNPFLYKPHASSTTMPLQTQSTTINSPFFPTHNEADEHKPYQSAKRKFSDYEDNNSPIATFNHMSASLHCNNSEESDEDDDDDEEDEEDDGSTSEDDEDETISDEQIHRVHLTTPTTPPSCTILQRRHSDTISTSYGSPIVKRRCTYSSMHDDEQKRSVLFESYRKLRGVKKPKLQVSLLICNLIKNLEKTFAKSPPPSLRQQQQQDEHVQYYQQHRTTYRSSSSDSIYMSSLSSTLVNDETDTSNQQYSLSHSSAYESDKVLIPINDLRSSPMYHPSSTDAYWLAQSNFATPVVSTSDDDDVDVSLHGGGDYLDLSDNTLSSSFSSSSPSSTPAVSSSNDCCCSSSTTSSTTLTKILVDTNNNHHHHHHHHQNNHDDGYFIYHPQSPTSTGQTFFYPHNGNNTVDIITNA